MEITFNYEVRKNGKKTSLFIRKMEDTIWVSTICIPSFHRDYQFAMEKINASNNIQDTLVYLDSVL